MIWWIIAGIIIIYFVVNFLLMRITYGSFKEAFLEAGIMEVLKILFFGILEFIFSTAADLFYMFFGDKKKRYTEIKRKEGEKRKRQF